MNKAAFYAKAQQLLLRWIVIVVPTVVVGYITLRYLNFSYTAFATGVGYQATFYGLGLLTAYSLYFFRARWVVTFMLLGLVYWIASGIIAKLPGEFDVFYATARFELDFAVFLLGWVFGFLLARVRYSYILLCAILAVVTLVSVSNTIDVSTPYMLLHLVPVLVYGLYRLFLTPGWTSEAEMSWAKSGRLFLRFSAFLILAILAFLLASKWLHNDLKAVEKELEARGEKDNKKDGSGGRDGGYDDRYGLMDKPGRGDDGYRLKDTMKLSTKMSQSDVLMFCSKLENFYPDGTPIPLYFVYHYLTRYDAAKESFTRDVNVPFPDEFNTDPSELALYHSREDTTVVRNSLANKKRFAVAAKVYLSSNTWKHALLAPGAAFFCQALPVEKDFQKTFLSAYQVVSYTSELNNAYLVYNPSVNPILEHIQDERFNELRSVANYRHVDSAFYAYYTQLPKGPLYDSIARLAHDLPSLSGRPADAVRAVRDFFLKRDEDGKRIFRYTLKPGQNSDPNIPSALMLRDFLFKTHAGYCTYYAGASLFLLRSLGIPSRFTTGFAAVDRTDKNKGWYWFYASQAHAWTQVYFPGYGWLDFDMTIGNEDQQNAPRPDGTPPLPPPDPWLVLNARAENSPDTKLKRLDVSFNQILYFDKGYKLTKTFTRTLDVSRCRVLYDKKDTTLSCVRPGDSVVVVSYKGEARRIPQPRQGIAIERQVEEFPAPIIADELHIKSRGPAGKKDAPKQRKPEEDQKIDWLRVARITASVLGAAVVLLLLLPGLYAVYLVFRRRLAKGPLPKAEHIYRAALYQFHMTGVERGDETPLDYARTRIDPSFAAGFEEFMHIYLRLKYSTEGPRPADAAVINRFGRNYGPAIRKKTGLAGTLVKYGNPLLASRYFFKSQSNDYTPQSQVL